MDRHVDVLIAGAGPGGSAAAIRCARLGLSVALLDRARFPRDKACSEYMSPEAVRHLDALGVLDALDAAGGHALAGTTVVGPRGARLTGRFALAGGAPFRPTGLSLARRILDATLVDAARRAGVAVHEGMSVSELVYDGGAVAGVVARGPGAELRTVRARLVIGADGLRSTVARRLGPRRHGVPSRIAFVAHVAGVPGLGAEAEMHVGREGYVGLNPIGGGVTNVALVVPRRVAAAAKGDPASFFYHMMERFPGVAGRVRREGERRPPIVTGPFAASTGQVTAPGALLLGDAAEFFDPFTGEGILSALRGAALAAETAGQCLAREGRVSGEALAAYRALRREQFAGQWAVERLIGWGMFLPRLFDRAVGRLARHDLGHTFVGVTGDILPARAVLSPSFLWRMIL
ncbi:MAG: NAD(P)/FAD-dependent oxidoreductase [Gemmatimonadetes bacterium]|nr:NAD(P)/FAD-dependent oxidoreductase [Gemmatimonadota bacterium]